MDTIRKSRSNFYSSILISFFLIHLQGSTFMAEGYDGMDPKGNITIKWDVIKWHADTYDALITITNNQIYRHVERPGWRLSWTWEGEEVIWNMIGAEATEQGDCSDIRSDELPHSCLKKPVIIDLLEGAAPDKKVSNCCKGGYLTTKNQDPTKYGASFQMNVGRFVAKFDDENEKTGHIHNNNSGYKFNVSHLIIPIPQSFSIGLPGYTCDNATRVSPSRFTEDRGRRHTQALRTWDIVCTYSQYQATLSPTCCVSMSAFYSENIVNCPACSCACQGAPGTKCIKSGDSPPLMKKNNEDEVLPPKILCSQHMCPIKIHWHVKTNYKEYWRVKVTINNHNFAKNYTKWSLVAQHPAFRTLTQVFSFEYKLVDVYKKNDTFMFWGKPYFNDMLMQSGDSGNVQTEILFKKESMFTFEGGWAFPRKISFNGDACVMPPPDQYPTLPT